MYIRINCVNLNLACMLSVACCDMPLYDKTLRSWGAYVDCRCIAHTYVDNQTMRPHSKLSQLSIKTLFQPIRKKFWLVSKRIKET